MRLILPLILLLVGVGGGVGAGLFLAPAAEAAGDAVPDTPLVATVEDTPEETDPEDPASGLEYARLSNQFIVPIVNAERMTALVVLTISIEVPSGEKERVFEHEPRLRNALLQVMFDHANLGGFDGVFTANDNMGSLRDAMRNTARDTLGRYVSNVLILDVVRQDLPG